MKIMKSMFLALTLSITIAVNVWATPVTFIPDSIISSVSITSSKWTNNGSLKKHLTLNNTPFTLGDNETQELDFFKITGGRRAWDEDYNIVAILAFSSPYISTTENGRENYFTLNGILSKGNLSWNTAKIPEIITLSDGNQVKIDFDDGWTVRSGNESTVHAYITNLGGAIVPTQALPEPVLALLLGFGLIGLSLLTRKVKI